MPVAHLALVLLVVLFDQRLGLAQRHRRQSNISGATLVTFLLWSSKGIGNERIPLSVKLTEYFS
jgi:hypothetical protein